MGKAGLPKGVRCKWERYRAGVTDDELDQHFSILQRRRADRSGPDQTVVG